MEFYRPNHVLKKKNKKSTERGENMIQNQQKIYNSNSPIPTKQFCEDGNSVCITTKGRKGWATINAKTLKFDDLDSYSGNSTYDIGELGIADIQKLFDEASGLVNDINHLLGPGVPEMWNGSIRSLSSVDVLANEVVEPTYSVGSRASTFDVTNPEELDSLRMEEFASRSHSDSRVSSTDFIVFSNTQLIGRCVAENSLKEPHIKYLKTLTTTELSYHLYPFASLIESNEVIKILLTYLVKCPYLLASLLAFSATFQFDQNGKTIHDNARQIYIMECFNSLNAAFTENSVSGNLKLFTSNIEKLLLTVLILSSYFTATNFNLDDNVLTSWKEHLRGARDLLSHYGKIPLESRESQNHPMSAGLALAKCWFFAIESSAAVHSITGGSLAKIREKVSIGLEEDKMPYDLFNLPDDNQRSIYWESGVFDAKIPPEYNAALQGANMICSSPLASEFNLFWGFTSRTVQVYLLYSSMTDSIRSGGCKKVPISWIIHSFRLIDECALESIVPEAERRSFEIPKTSRGHPEYSGLNSKLIFPDSCYVSDTDESGETVVYSWFDASHQLHLENILVKLMVQKSFLSFPRSHPHVQEELNRLFSAFFFIKRKASPAYRTEKDNIIVESDNYYLCKPSFDNRCVMIQSFSEHWPQL